MLATVPVDGAKEKIVLKTNPNPHHPNETQSLRGARITSDVAISSNLWASIICKPFLRRLPFCYIPGIHLAALKLYIRFPKKHPASKHQTSVIKPRTPALSLPCRQTGLPKCSRRLYPEAAIEPVEMLEGYISRGNLLRLGLSLF